MDFGSWVWQLASRLRNLVFASVGTISLSGQVIWDDTAVATAGLFKDDFVKPLVTDFPSDPTSLSLRRDSGSQKLSLGSVPAVLAVSVRAGRQNEDAPQSEERRASTGVQGFVSLGAEAPGLIPVPVQSLFGRSDVSRRLAGIATPAIAGNALPDGASTTGNLLPSAVTTVNPGGSFVEQPLFWNSPPILAGSTPVWLAYYPFTGNSPASVDSDPLSAASSLANIGLGYLKYNPSIGNPAPALQLDASDVPGSFMLGSYLVFTITANPGYVLNLDEFRFDIRAMSTASPYTVNYQLRTSLDGFAAAVLTGSVTSALGSFTTVTVPLGPVFTNLGNIEFRLLFSDSNQGARNYILVDNITVIGSTVLVPEPKMAIEAVGLLLLGLLPFRKNL